ncbi:MAG: hypothetical protein V8T53_06710 [Eubacteriales bacterium]
MCTGAASLALYRLMFVTFFNRDLLTTWAKNRFSMSSTTASGRSIIR